ncbi:hypothetical protein DQ04_16311010 [Trypanosoma grayi]|uniref:hypothetical protein n=1 Tax=Trypanosoma grayi TaxID=71804 RepID=UPI0004F46838|nr:hypothetical protein DQ04_16311010 [Trypanosoma grayi]KEG06047.1 hypothetical protein DQ04_16311010 [Trypanosoma grayi]
MVSFFSHAIRSTEAARDNAALAHRSSWDAEQSAEEAMRHAHAIPGTGGSGDSDEERTKLVEATEEAEEMAKKALNESENALSNAAAALIYAETAAQSAALLLGLTEEPGVNGTTAGAAEASNENRGRQPGAQTVTPIGGADGDGTTAHSPTLKSLAGKAEGGAADVSRRQVANNLAHVNGGADTTDSPACVCVERGCCCC